MASAGRRWSIALAIALTGAVVHSGPAVTALRPVRVRFFPALSGIGDPGHVALTFDDGPDPVSTPRFLEMLDHIGVRATFFVLGEKLARHRWIGRAMAAAGHEVGVHGWNHAPLLSPVTSSLTRDLTRSLDLVTEVTGVRPRWFRPPRGLLTRAALISAQQAHLTPVLWSSWGKDWRPSSTPVSVLRTVVSSLGPGGTILLHDRTAAAAGWRASLAALPALVAVCRERGLRLGPLSEHAGIRHEASSSGESL
jgi:peptidoglycan-N-acetylglucosamine deacetylase